MSRWLRRLLLGSMMRELTLDESKAIQIEMLRSLDACCRANGIEYSLAYGTLIGAVRHKGFIPWDDDIDVTMTRDNFEKFLRVYTHERYALLKPMRRKRWEFFARIVDPRTKTRFKAFPVSPFPLWLTIFPVDNRPDNEQQWLEMKAEVDHFANQARMKCGVFTRDWKRNIVKVLAKVAYLPVSLRKANARALNALTRYDTVPTTQKIVWVSYNRYETYPSSLFDAYVDLDFEQIRCRAMAGYDTYLRTAYGDYMQLPPAEQQVPSHEFTTYLKD